MNGVASKSNDALMMIYQLMANERSTIEWRTNIDPKPPMTFHKDCLVNESIISIDEYFKKLETGEIQITNEPEMASLPPEDTKKTGLKGLFSKFKKK